MRRAGGLLLLPFLAMVGACSDNQPALPPIPETKEKLARFEFSLEKRRYAISLPAQAGMRDRIDPKSITFDARKGQRLQKLLVISTEPAKPGPAFDREHRLRGSNPRLVRYRRTDDAGAGSGGRLSSIDGEFEVGVYRLFLYCSDQGEWSVYPDWCLEYLETLELTPEPSDNG